MATSVNQLENHITCSVCLEVYTDPHSLRCLHTYCYQCIQGLKQENRVQCPDCRQFTHLSEVKKDFKMESLIGINRNMSEKDANPQETVCDLCDDSAKSVESFCSNCEKHLCANCSKAHRRIRATKDHKLVSFAELEKSKKQKMDEYIQIIIDEEREMDSKCTSNRELIHNIKQAEMRQITEVNRLRWSIIDDVDSHHDNLIKEIQSINLDTIRSLEQQGQMFTAAKRQIVDKMQYLADVSQSHNITLLTDTLKILSERLTRELLAIRSKLPRLDMNVRSLVQVVKGADWNPRTSTRVEVAGTSGRGPFCHDVPGEITVASPRGIPSTQTLVRNVLHHCNFREQKVVPQQTNLPVNSDLSLGKLS